MKSYDVILAGGGAAGLSLAYHLSRGPLRDASILIVDREVKRHNDHTWCSWLREPEPFDAIAYRTWDRLAFFGEDFEAVIPLAPYRYRMIRGIDFYRFTREALAPRPNVDVLQGNVERVVDGPDHAEVLVNEQTFRGRWVFDSRYDVTTYLSQDPCYHNLLQHFVGWEIETPTPAFDPEVPHLFDFRTPQRGQMRFVYLLPYSERRALVEYTLFSCALLPLTEYEAALRTYIAEVLGVDQYRLLAEERDIIPMTERPFPRSGGRRVMNIGTRGGRVKASTGYAFHRIQEDSAAIVTSLVRHGHPFDVPKSPRRYRTFDAILLQTLYRHGHRSKRVFTDLFRNNPIDRLFRFLDEEGGLWENIQVMASVPACPFTRAFLRTKLLRRV